MESYSFDQWKSKIIHLRDKVILPDNSSVYKGRWIGNNGFDYDEFDVFLEDLFNTKYKKDER